MIQRGGSKYTFDMPFGIASGAGIIFGNTGGVMEAVIRDVASDVLDKVTLADLLADPQSVVAMPTSRRLAAKPLVPGLPDKVA